MSGLEVMISNRQKRTRLSVDRLSLWTQRILKALGWRKVRLSLVLVNKAEMRSLHRKYLGDGRETDVLAFKHPAPLLGDVAVSIPAAKEMGPRFGNRWDEELLLYVCHGILHLMGYRDSTAREKARMDSKQERILQTVLGKKWRSKNRKPLF